MQHPGVFAVDAGSILVGYGKNNITGKSQGMFFVGDYWTEFWCIGLHNHHDLDDGDLCIYVDWLVGMWFIVALCPGVSKQGVWQELAQVGMAADGTVGIAGWLVPGRW